MKKTFVILLFFAVGLILLWFSFFSTSAQTRYIKKEIINANYCETVSDCQMVAQSQCPFGCYIYVNTKESTRIKKLLKSYKSNCVYSCVELKGVECINNNCQILQ